MVERASSVLITPVVRASYVNLAKAKASMGSKDEKFSLNLIFEPEDAAAVYAEILKVAKAQFGDQAEALFASGGLSQPLKDGSKPNKKTLVVDPTTVGKWVISAKAAADKQPVCVASDGVTALNPAGIYSGCYVRAQISIYTFSMPENQGVAVGVNYVQFVKDGEKLGGGAPTLNEAKSIFGVAPGAAPAALPNHGFATPGAAVAPTGSLPGLPT